MNALLYIGGKRIRNSFSIGWYKGEPFHLISIQLFSKFDDIDSLYIFQIQFLKFQVCWSIDWEIG